MRQKSAGKMLTSVPFAGLLVSLLLSGCILEKRVVSPYEGRSAREEARVEHEVVSPPPVHDAMRSAPQVEQIDSAPPIKDVLMPTLTLINERIFAYEQKLADWRELNMQDASLRLDQEKLNRINACRQQLQEVLLGYNTLHQRLLAKDSVTAAELLAGESLLSLEKKDILYLESDCQAMTRPQETGKQVIVDTGKNELRQDKQVITEAYAAGNFDEVIRRYEQMRAVEGEALSYDVTFHYGQALMKSQRQAEARQVFNDLLATIRQQEQAQWEFRLMHLIGDLEFGLQVYDAAENHYREISQIYAGLSEKNDWAIQQLAVLKADGQQDEERDRYAELLLAYLGYNSERDGFSVLQQGERFLSQYPYSRAASSVDRIVQEMRIQAQQWFISFIGRVDALAAENKYQDALLMIERVPSSILPLAQRNALQAKTDELTTTEAITIETRRLVQEQTLQEEWNTAMTHLQARKYDEAIEVFARLQETSYAERAVERIDEAVKLAAQEDRQRAAELFVRANRTQDLESRMKLLFASRQLLQDILIKYPQAGLAEKVKKNLNRIDEELRAIDPALLTVPTTVGGDQQQTGGGTPVATEEGREMIEPMSPSQQINNMNIVKE